MDVKQVMKKKVYTVTQKTKLKTVWSLIFKKNINSIPVVDEKKKLLGIVTREDILHSLYPDYQEYIENLFSSEKIQQKEKSLKDNLDVPIKKLMKSHVIFTRMHTPIARALGRMMARRVDQLPVLSDKDVLVGIVSKHDIFNALYIKHKRMFFPSPSKKRS